jgi:hypothetical protein
MAVESSYIVRASGLTWSAGYNLLALRNNDAALLVKVYRVVFINKNGTGAVAGTGVFVGLGRFTGAVTGGSGATFVKIDTANTDVDADITATYGSTGITMSIANTYRQIFFGNDEITSTSFFQNNFNCIPQYSTIWDTGYQDETLQPITLRQDQGLVIQAPSSGGGTYAGTVDAYMEFTIV